MAELSKAEQSSERVSVIARFTDGTGGEWEAHDEFMLTGDGLTRLRHLTDLLWAEHLIRRCIEWERGYASEPPSQFTARLPGGYRAHRMDGTPVDLDTPLARYHGEALALRLYLLPEE